MTDTTEVDTGVDASAETAAGSRAAGAELAVREHPDRGMTTAEYAVGTIAAIAFAAVLLKVIKDDSVFSTLLTLVTGFVKAAMKLKGF